jgi:hypothetical protein
MNCNQPTRNPARVNKMICTGLFTAGRNANRDSANAHAGAAHVRKVVHRAHDAKMSRGE